MNRIMIALSFVLALTSTVAAQSHQHTATTISGKDHPEQISDNKAWLMQLIAETTTPKGEKRTARPVGLSGLNPEAVADFRSQFDKLTTTYNAKLSDGKYGTTEADIALRDKLNQDVEDLLTLTVGKLQNSAGPEQWPNVVKHIQENKARITVTDDTQSAPAIATSAVYHPGHGHLQRTQGVTYSFASAGYTTFTELDTDGTYWYQTVNLYGSSNATWTCEYNSYDGVWEPPGCPDPHHDFYTSNQIGGQGWTNYYETTEWNPAQYVSISHQLQAPVNGRTSASTAGIVICSVAGYLMNATWSIGIAFAATTWEHWKFTTGTYSDGSKTCNVYADCSNQPPYALDLPYVIARWPLTKNQCSLGDACVGACSQLHPWDPWVCTTDPAWALCKNLPNGPPNPPQQCTAAP